MAPVATEFQVRVGELVDQYHGFRPVEQDEGHRFVAVFPIAVDAVAFALDLQRRLVTERWAGDLSCRARLAVHTGVAQLGGAGNFTGAAVNRCDRIRALARGGQIVLSEATRALIIDELPVDSTLVDAGHHKLRDFDRREHLFVLAHPDLVGVSRRLPGHGASDLPRYLTSFVAREEELAAVARALESSALVTLTGAAGSGKTRLAVECARGIVERFTDGVAWADAATITEGDLLGSRVASALGINESPTEAVTETVARELEARHLLLILDNCEHVIDAAAALVERLIAAAPRLRVMATSREPLGLVGEATIRVPSLDVGAAERLFVDRSRAIAPDFELAAETRGAVVEICERLDGIPLAVELAAARTSVLTPRQIADALTDRFALLTGGSRTALPRQQTLEASVEWSYQLLSDEERVLLDRLSVFAGGFSLAAARSVCAFGAIDDSAVLELLASLVDKSLVQVEDAGDHSECRYRLLETIRHFGQQHLVADADAADVRDRHLMHFLELAETTAPAIELASDGDVSALARLDADVGNLRAARSWAHQRADADRLLRLVAALWLFHEIRCHFDEATRWLKLALDATHESSAVRAEALRGLGEHSLFTNDIETVLASGEEAVAIGEQLDDPLITARGRTLLGWAAAFGVGHEPRWGVEILHEVVESLEPGAQPWLEADANIGLSMAALLAGDISRSATAARQAIAIAQASGSVGSLQRGHCYLGMALAAAGHLSEASDAALACIAFADDLEETFFKAAGLATLSVARCTEGDLEEATALANEALDLSCRTANPFGVAVATATLAQAYAARSQAVDALAVIEGSRVTVAAVDLWTVTVAIESVVALIEVQERPADARARLVGLERSGSPGRWILALHRGWVERIVGDEAAAEAAFATALDGAVRAGADGDALAALHELGVSACRRGQCQRAARLFGAAQSVASSRSIAPRPRPPSLRSRAEDYDGARQALGDDAFDMSWAAGAALGLDEATRFALRGKGGRRRPTSGWESLTTTELEVVRLVSQGLSNPAIAERMFITRGTVKVHLSHVFTKLGVRSRAELAAAAVHRAPTD